LEEERQVKRPASFSNRVEPTVEARAAKGGFRTLLNACRNVSVYLAVLPYNLTWLRDFSFAAPFLHEYPIRVVDVGARSFSLKELDPFREFIELHAFDADPEECARLAASSTVDEFKSFEVLPFFVGDRNGKVRFNIYQNESESSQLLPHPDFQRSFNGKLSVVRTIEVESVTLDSLATRTGLEADVLKLDAQGTEHAILANAGALLEKALIVECEVEFLEMYQDQKLFHDVCDLLYQRGYVVLYLNRVFASRKNYHGHARGQLIFGDALFGLDKAAASRLDPVQKKKYALLLICYGLLDYAHELLLEDSEMRRISPELITFFKRVPDRDRSWGKAKRAAWMQVDKLIAMLLYMRRTNQLRYDSDRSWPIR
jgi:FkbM family methyltransferase